MEITIDPLAKPRLIHHGCGLTWMKEKRAVPGASFVTSLPDFTELSALSLSEWKKWFVEAAALVMECCPPEGVAIFYQRDSKHEGTWVEKSYLIQKAAELTGSQLLWHKIVCRAPAGQVTFGRPAYSHLLCFSRELRLPLSSATADVLASAGEATWARGMGVKACQVACRFILDETKTRKVVDPFCGHGTVLAVAEAMGLEAEGVELGGKRAEKARSLRISLE